jgi:hypothetical protein
MSIVRPICGFLLVALPVIPLFSYQVSPPIQEGLGMPKAFAAVPMPAGGSIPQLGPGANCDQGPPQAGGTLTPRLPATSLLSSALPVQGELTASDAAPGDYFGRWIAINGDTALIGAFGDNSCTGSAYIFVRNGTTWTQQAKLTASDGVAGDAFGRAVAISGDTAVVGTFQANNKTGAVYVFGRVGTTWTQLAKLNATPGGRATCFGRSVSFSGDTIAVGAHCENNSTGAVYVFVGGGSTWVQQARITAPDGAPSEYFGRSIALDGNTLLAGAYFNAVRGSAYVFVRDGVLWTNQAKLTPTDAAYLFGYTVSLSGDTAVIGAPGTKTNTGSAYVYTRNGTLWTARAALTSPTPKQNGSFAYAVAVNGVNVFIGAWNENSAKGAAYIFRSDQTSWNLYTTLTAPDGIAGDTFGYEVVIDGATAICGAYAANSAAGSAYVFVIPPPNPLPALTNLDPPTALAAPSAFTLTINGSDFVPGATVLWNGVSRPTTYVSPTRLTASINGPDVVAPGTATVAVSNPGPGGGNSSPFTYTIASPVPAVTSLQPTAALVGGAPFNLGVYGSNFVNGAVVLWNGSPRTTIYAGTGKLVPAITAEDIASPGSATITVSNPSPGGGPSNPLTFGINWPYPTISAVSPSSAIVGGVDLTLMVTGTKFIPQSVVNWNGSPRPTAYVNGTQLQASITAADIAATGGQRITVTNPAPGGGTTGQIGFPVNNPVPAVISMSPSSATHGGRSLTITVTGSNFNSISLVQWNGAYRLTTFVNPTTLTATITAGDIAAAGTAQVTVSNQAPGGGVSAPLPFTIN